MVRDRRPKMAWRAEAANAFVQLKALCGGGRESNPPTDSRRRTGFEGRRGLTTILSPRTKTTVWAAQTLGAYLVTCSSVRAACGASREQIREHRRSKRP